MLSLNEDEYEEKDDKDMDYDGLLDCVRPTFLIPGLLFVSPRRDVQVKDG